MDFDTSIKLAVYQCFASTGKAPLVGELARQFACSPDEVRSAFARLQASRVLLLEPDGETIRMAPPFSGVPTPHRVEVGRQTYSANCAWDALGIPAALHREAVVHSSCGQSGAPFRLQVGLEGPEPSRWLFHCQVPAARWWVDLVFTWSTMLFFRSEELVQAWCQARGIVPRPLVTIAQLWQLAVEWYATRLSAEARRPGPQEMRRIFARLGLTDPFWDPQADVSA
jgi:hypothetical protein